MTANANNNNNNNNNNFIAQTNTYNISLQP
jgi:hypothetical protein